MKIHVFVLLLLPILTLQSLTAQPSIDQEEGYFGCNPEGTCLECDNIVNYFPRDSLNRGFYCFWQSKIER